MQDDILLSRYLQDGSEAAFSQIVARHLTLVYRACLRETGSAAQAEDASQVVFLLLAGKARTLRGRPSLVGWLYQTAVFVAKNARKQEERRKLREQAVMHEIIHGQEAPNPEWDAVEPLLNNALSALKPADREAVLLRFLEGHTLAETGILLGLSEDAARMRVTRAVEKLRVYLTAHGAAVTGIILTGLLTTEAVRPISAHATTTITQGTLQALSAGPAANVLLLSKGVTHTMKIIKIKYAALAAATLVAGASVPPLVHALAAQTPSAASATVTQTIVLQHSVPVDLVKFLKWDNLSNLPTGVTKIQSLPAQNALAITATPAGLAKVLKIIKPLDVEPRQVSIVSAFARASDADVKASAIRFYATRDRFYATGNRAVQFYQALKQQKKITEAPNITTTNNVTATIIISTTLPSGKIAYEQVTVTPQVNGDDSVTMMLHSVFADGAVKNELKTTLTVKNNDTMVIMLPKTVSQAAGENMLFFITPTVK